MLPVQKFGQNVTSVNLLIPLKDDKKEVSTKDGKKEDRATVAKEKKNNKKHEHKKQETHKEKDNQNKKMSINEDGKKKKQKKKEDKMKKRQLKNKEKELPQHCNSTTSTVKEILIRGERHSGTNWIRKILVQNIKNVKLQRDSRLYGWKHAFLPPLGWGNPLSGDAHLLVVVTRDVFTWLPKMYEESYDAFMNLKRNHTTFSEFIRTDYAAQCHPEPEPENKYLIRRAQSGSKRSNSNSRNNEPNQVAFCSKIVGNNGTFEYSTSVGERAENIIQIRTKKYKQWLSNDPDDGTYVGSRDKFLENRIHLKLESLYEPVNVNSNSNNDNSNSATAEDHIRLQEDILGKALDDHCLKRYDDFQGISTHQSWGDTSHHKQNEAREKVFDAVEERRELLGVYSEDDLKFVLSQLDIDFERQIGYDYSFMLEKYL